MPTYEYLCKKCGEQFDIFQSFSARPLKKHPDCGGEVQKVFHARGVVFKGSGFYVTDSKASRSAAAQPGGSSSESGGSSPDSGGSSPDSGGKDTDKSTDAGDSKKPSKPDTTNPSSDKAKSSGESAKSRATSGRSDKSGSSSKSDD